MNKWIILTLITVVLILTGYFLKKSNFNNSQPKYTPTPKKTEEGLNPLTIEAMKKRSYPGSEMKIEQSLDKGVNFNRYVASYMSDGLKIYGLLTVPADNPSTSSGHGKPSGGWPVMIFNHGYIPPKEYRTTERYVAYQDYFARAGYITFKSDYRGHGESEGRAEGAYYSPAYTIDILNALSSLKKFPDANSQRIGMWGHSLGGNITLRAMVISSDIKAGVIWAGVVGSYDDLLNNWHSPSSDLTPEQRMHVLEIRNAFVRNYGLPASNPKFWDSIDPTKHLSEISGSIQLHQGLADQTVPPVFSEHLKKSLEEAHKNVELYTYPGADHNLSDPAFSLAMQRSLEFFNKYLNY